MDVILEGVYPSKDVIKFAADARTAARARFSGSDLALLLTQEQVWVRISETASEMFIEVDRANKSV